MKKTLTVKQIRDLDNACTEWFTRNEYFTPAVISNSQTIKPGFFTEKPNTKLSANMKNIAKQLAGFFEEYRGWVENLRIDNCSVDEKTKTILYNPNGTYQFTKEALKKLTLDIKSLDTREFEINIRITEGDWNLTDEEREIFAGILISEATEQAN